MSLLRAELTKLLRLPSARGAIGAGLVLAPLLTYFNSTAVLALIHDGDAVAAANLPDAGFMDLAYPVITAIILGVVAVSSEYLAGAEDSGGGRQIYTSLVAVPSRVRLLLAKTGALALTVAALAAGTATVTVVISRAALDEYAAPFTGQTVLRILGVVLYWVFAALIACGATLLTRSGVVPLTVLILNNSVVSVTYLIAEVVPAANYFPDLVGARMFLHNAESAWRIGPVTGGLAMFGWALAALTVGGVVFHRRDA
jgi:hypothetical protein